MFECPLDAVVQSMFGSGAVEFAAEIAAVVAVSVAGAGANVVAQDPLNCGCWLFVPEVGVFGLGVVWCTLKL